MKKEINKKNKDPKTNHKKEKKVNRITMDMNLGEIAWKYPLAAEVLMDYGLHCVGCAASSFDTIEMGAKLHGMSKQEIQEMVDRINEVLSFNE